MATASVLASALSPSPGGTPAGQRRSATSATFDDKKVAAALSSALSPTSSRHPVRIDSGLAWDRTAIASPPAMSSASAASMNTGQPSEARGTGEVPEEALVSKMDVSKDGKSQMWLHDSKGVIPTAWQKIIQPRQAPPGKNIFQPMQQQQQQQQQQRQQQQTYRPGPEARQHVFLQSCSPAGSKSFRNINECAVKWPLPVGSLQDEKEHPHVGPQRMANSAVEFLQGRMTLPKLQYREAVVNKQQSGPGRGIDDNLLKLWDQNLEDATGGMKVGEDRPRGTTGMSETPCPLHSTTFLGAVGSTPQTCAAKNVVQTPECGSRKDVNEIDVMSVSTRSCTDDGEASSVKRPSALSVIDRQEEQCAGALFFDLAADDLDEDEAEFFPEYNGFDHRGRKSNTRKSMYSRQADAVARPNRKSMASQEAAQ